MASSIDGGSAPTSARRALALLIILAAQLMLCMDLLIVVVALGIAVIASIYSFAVVPGQYTSGLPAAFGSGAAIALISAVVAWFCVRNPSDTNRCVHDRKPDEARATECAG